MPLKILIFSAFSLIFFSCSQPEDYHKLPWEKHGKLKVEENSTIIQYEDGTPFLWLGSTSWGMSEWNN